MTDGKWTTYTGIMSSSLGEDGSAVLCSRLAEINRSCCAGHRHIRALYRVRRERRGHGHDARSPRAGVRGHPAGPAGGRRTAGNGQRGRGGGQLEVGRRSRRRRRIRSGSAGVRAPGGMRPAGCNDGGGEDRFYSVFAATSEAERLQVRSMQQNTGTQLIVKILQERKKADGAVVRGRGLADGCKGNIQTCPARGVFKYFKLVECYSNARTLLPS